MPPKQKRKASTSVKAEKKSKRQKIEDKETSSIDSGFQNINNDIARHILHYVKLVTKDLKALSETCSSWHVKINTYYREIFAHTLPFSHKKYKGAQRQEIIAEIAQARKHVSDIQIFEFNQDKDINYEELIQIKNAVSIPWCTDIILVIEEVGWELIDLKKPDPILRFRFTSDRGALVSYSINTRRKQLLLLMEYERNFNKPELMKMTEEDWIAFYHYSREHIQLMLRIYDINDHGEVKLVNQRDLKVQGSTRAAILRDDGSVWRAKKNQIEFFQSLDSDRVEIYNYPGRLREYQQQNIMGFIEVKGALKYILLDSLGINVHQTLIYDAETKKLEELPVECELEDYNITYVSDSLQFTFKEYKCAFPGSCNLDPIIQLEIEPQVTDEVEKSAYIDGSRLLEYRIDGQTVQIILKERSDYAQNYNIILQSNIRFDANDKQEEEIIDDGTGTLKKRTRQSEIFLGCLIFWWLSRDIVIATYEEEKLAILDFRSGSAPADGYSFLEMTLMDRILTLHPKQFVRVDDTSFAVINERDSLTTPLFGVKFKL